MVWLTAATVLVAGTPHLVCACPDGGEGGAGNACSRCRPTADAKPTANAARHGCCCCKGQPKPRPSAKPVKATPAHQQAPDKARLTAPTCVKALAPAATFTPSHAPTTAHPDLASSLAGLAYAPALDLARTATAAAAPWDAHHTLPPTDRLALCQRLLL